MKSKLKVVQYSFKFTRKRGNNFFRISVKFQEVEVSNEGVFIQARACHEPTHPSHFAINLYEEATRGHRNVLQR